MLSARTTQDFQTFPGTNTPPASPLQTRDDEKHAHLASLLEGGRDGGLDTFGNVGNLRVPALVHRVSHRGVCPAHTSSCSVGPNLRRPPVWGCSQPPSDVRRSDVSFWAALYSLYYISEPFRLSVGALGAFLSSIESPSPAACFNAAFASRRPDWRFAAALSYPKI